MKWDFPGGPEVKPLHCRGCGFNPMPYGMAQKYKNRKTFFKKERMVNRNRLRCIPEIRINRQKF